MTVGLSITFDNLTNSFDGVLAVNNLSFTVQPGRVTGFLGPNGAGKTTTLRCLLGLIEPVAGSAVIGGHRYRELDQPLSTVGASLEATTFHPGRSARNHLRIHAIAGSVNPIRVDTVLERVGLGAYGDRRVGAYSLGMRQRLGLAMALLADPGVLVLDEPINGLDPEGIRWMRSTLAELAAEGRTVLISSHLLSEVQQTVDDVVVISRGSLAFQGTLDELTSTASTTRVLVDSPNRELLATVLGARATVAPHAQGLLVSGLTAAEVGQAAFAGGVPLSRLETEGGGIEDIFLAIVGQDHTEGDAA
jgi:ABC-2 type transport system ATP-binding protein